VLRQQFVDQPARKAGLHDAAAGQRVQRLAGKGAQAGVPCCPDAEGQAKALFLLRDDLVGQEAKNQRSLSPLSL